MHRRRVLKSASRLALCQSVRISDLPRRKRIGATKAPMVRPIGVISNRRPNLFQVGCRQSPISIDSTIEARLATLEFAWARQANTIVNNGHTIQLNSTWRHLTVGSNRYTLVSVSLPIIRVSIASTTRLSNGGTFRFIANAAGSLGVIRRVDGGWQVDIRCSPKVVADHAAGRRPARQGPIPGIDPNGLLPAKLWLLSLIPVPSLRRPAVKLSTGCY